MAVSLIVTDGGVQGLLAVAAAAERALPDHIAFYWHPGVNPERVSVEREAVHAQGKLYGLSEAPEQIPTSWPRPRDSFEADCRVLMEAALLVRQLGGGEVIWPVTAPEASGGGPEVEAVARALNQGLLISELVSVTAPALRAGEEVSRVRVRAPYSDLTDRRIADLVLDMDLPVWTCWFWDGTDEAAAGERARWTAALRQAGWTGSFHGADEPRIMTRPLDINTPASRGNGEAR